MESMFLKLSTTALFVGAILTGCTVSDDTTTPSAANDDQAFSEDGALRIDIFSARGFLGGSEYERYYLTDKILWRECGSVVSAAREVNDREHIEGDEVLTKDPQLKIQQRRVEKLSNSQIRSLRSAAASVLGTVKTGEKHTEPAPGSVFSLSSPGVFELLVELGGRKERIISSVDAVADKRSATLEKAHELFAALRGVGPEICGASTFYGIDRRKL